MSKPICTFYSKTNSCKHGQDCIKLHNKNENNPVILLKNLYLYPPIDTKSQLSPFEVQLHTDFFITDIFTRLMEDYGQIKDFIIAINSCKHIAGNVYVQFCNLEDADNALVDLINRTYNFTKLKVERGAMRNIVESVCEDFIKRKCNKGGECSYVHPLKVCKEGLFRVQYAYYNDPKRINI